MPRSSRQTPPDAAEDSLRILQARNPGIDLGPLHDVIAARRRILMAQYDLHAATHTAQRAGFSWEVIGLILGISRQAAFKRFSQARHDEQECQLRRTRPGLLEPRHVLDAMPSGDGD